MVSFRPTSKEISHIRGSNIWSCCRYNANNAWYANGNNGFFNNNNFYNSNLCVPVSNLLTDKKW